MPFAGYEDMASCKEANSDKENPGGYCAQIHKDATGEWPGEKQKATIFDCLHAAHKMGMDVDEALDSLRADRVLSDD